MCGDLTIDLICIPNDERYWGLSHIGFGYLYVFFAKQKCLVRFFAHFKNDLSFITELYEFTILDINSL